MLQKIGLIYIYRTFLSLFCFLHSHIFYIPIASRLCFQHIKFPSIMEIPSAIAISKLPIPSIRDEETNKTCNSMHYSPESESYSKSSNHFESISSPTDSRHSRSLSYLATPFVSEHLGESKASRNNPLYSSFSTRESMSIEKED